MDVATILEQTVNTDEETRQAAQKFLENARRQNLPQYMLELSQQLSDESKSLTARQAAGIGLKNCLASKDDAIRTTLYQQWLSIESPIRNEIKQRVFLLLQSPQQIAASTAAQCVAAIAGAELPLQQWPDLIKKLLENVTTANSAESLKVSTLEAIGYICEEIEPQVLITEANSILTAVVQGMRKEETNRVRLAATKALTNSLEFVNENFKRDVERDFIMQVVCEATRCDGQDVVIAAFQALVRIMSLYYEYMEMYMRQALFSLTLEAMKSPVDEISMQGIEFWSTVCDVENDLLMELQESNTPSMMKFYAKGALPHILPSILELLTKQEEDDDDDAWNISMAASVCLSLLANCTRGEIIPGVIPFVTSNIKSTDWHHREAAVMAFGSILEGPDCSELMNITGEALPFIVLLTKDEMPPVKDTAAWCIGRICELVPNAVLSNEAVLNNVLLALISSLGDVPRVASNAAWALNTLSETAYNDAFIGEEVYPDTFQLTAAYSTIIAKLLEATERHDADQNNLRGATYEALMQMIRSSPIDCYPIVRDVTGVILERLENCLRMEAQIIGADDRLAYNEWQSLLCALLGTIIRRLNNEDIAASADRMMQILLAMFGSVLGKAGSVQEDALMAVTALLDVLEVGFLKYMEAFKGPLVTILRNHAEYQACSIAVGVVGDLCRTLGLAALPYCDDFMSVLLEDLADADLHRSVKPPILSALGDIALAIGTNFCKYLNITLQVLQQATMTVVNRDDYDLIDFLNDLREGCLDAYTGIIMSLKGDGPTPNSEIQLLQPHVAHIIEFISHITQDEHTTDGVIRAALATIGDLCSAYGVLILPYLKPFLDKLIRIGRDSRNKSTKQTAAWVHKTIKGFSS